jgi:hypothetical protein
MKGSSAREGGWRRSGPVVPQLRALSIHLGRGRVAHSAFPVIVRETCGLSASLFEITKPRLIYVNNGSAPCARISMPGAAPGRLSMPVNGLRDRYERRLECRSRPSWPLSGARTLPLTSSRRYRFAPGSEAHLSVLALQVALSPTLSDYPVDTDWLDRRHHHQHDFKAAAEAHDAACAGSGDLL